MREELIMKIVVRVRMFGEVKNGEIEKTRGITTELKHVGFFFVFCFF